MCADKESKGIVKTILTLAAELEKTVVAEGVETEEQRALLMGFACRYAQGYLFSRPVAVEVAEGLLRNGLECAKDEISVEASLQSGDVELLTGIYAM